MADKEDLQKRVREEEDYIRCSKFSNSLTKFVAKNSEGVDDSTIARLLLMEESEVTRIYQEAVVQLREGLSEE
jgi:hypothetical protein